MLTVAPNQSPPRCAAGPAKTILVGDGDQVIVAGSFQRVAGTRRYRTCAPKLRGGRPTL